ncbi:hypothetical protein ACFL5P_01275 [candidate division KSB1 bacterium]
MTDRCIRQIVSTGINIRTNTLLFADNSSEIENIIDHIQTLGVRHMLFSYPFPLGGTANPKGIDLVLEPERLTQIVERIVRATTIRDISVSFQGMPRCFLGPYADLQDRWIDRILVDVHHQFDRAIMLFDGLLGREYLPKCDICTIRDECAGTWPLSWHRTVFFEKDPSPCGNQCQHSEHKRGTR